MKFTQTGFKLHAGASLLAAVIVLAAWQPPAQAIPAFARKYGFSCSTCHLAIPKLKAYGEDFAGNGFSLEGDEEPARAFRDTGDDRLMLMRELPLGLRFDSFFNIREDADETNNDFQTPWGLKILSGGNIAPGIGYYMYFYFSERGEVAGIEDAYVHFNNIRGTELDVMVGQFQISDPLFKRELRLTYEDYQFYKEKVGASEANLAYDRGIFMTYSLPTSTELVFQIVNGNGKDEAGLNRLFDFDRNKNFFFRVSQDIHMGNTSDEGGGGVGLRIGGFTYFGNEDMGGSNNKFYYIGEDFTVNWSIYELTGQYIYRKDDNPLFVSGFTFEEEIESVIGELTVTPKDYLFLTLLYNQFSSTNGLLPDYKTASLNVSYLLRTNMRFFSEYRYDIEHERNRFVFGFVTGF